MTRRESTHDPGAPAALEDGAAHVGAALDYVTDAVILLRHDWSIEFVNVAFERACGRPRGADRQELLDQPARRDGHAIRGRGARRDGLARGAPL